MYSTSFSQVSIFLAGSNGNIPCLSSSCSLWSRATTSNGESPAERNSNSTFFTCSNSQAAECLPLAVAVHHTHCPCSSLSYSSIQHSNIDCLLFADAKMCTVVCSKMYQAHFVLQMCTVVCSKYTRHISYCKWRMLLWRSGLRLQ